jgi:hypothetical protein
LIEAIAACGDRPGRWAPDGRLAELRGLLDAQVHDEQGRSALS